MHLTRDLEPPASALAIAAHPDDVEFGCGATLAKWAAQGTLVHHLVLTDGSKGSWDPDQDTAELVEQRQREQRAATRALGATGEQHFLGRPDGELEATLSLRREVALVIRRTKADVVLGHDPWRRYRVHPDHRAAGFLAVDGVVAARDPHFYADSGVEHWRPHTLLLWEADTVHHVEDVTDHVDAKLAALAAHESQFRSTMHVEVGAPDEHQQRAAFERRVRDRLATFGRRIGVTYGEAFARINDL